MPGAGLSALPDTGTAGLGSLPDPLGAATDILEARRQGQTGNAPRLGAQWDALMQAALGDSVVRRTIAARDALRRGDAQAAHEATMPVAQDFASFVGSIKPVGGGISALANARAPIENSAMTQAAPKDLIESVRQAIEAAGGKVIGHDSSALSSSQYLRAEGIPVRMPKSIRRQFFERFPQSNGAEAGDLFTVRVADHPAVSGRGSTMFSIRADKPIDPQMAELRAMLEFLTKPR